MSANLYTLSGAYLTDDPQERLAGETPLVVFTCVDNAWNERRFKAKFVECSFSGKMADTARQLRKGDQVTVSGRLDYRTYESTRDKTTRVAFEIQRPVLLVPHVDLRDRTAPDTGDQSGTSLGGGENPPKRNAWDEEA